MKERIRNLKLSLLYRFARLFPDRLFLELLFPLRTGYKLNLKDPRTFNEKLQWLKLYDRNPEYTKMVDKFEAKKYVANIIGEDHIIPTLAVYDRVEDIDFDTLPSRFVLKCTHDSGGIVICKDKAALDKQAAIEKLRHGLKQNYFYQNREWPYKNVKPRIIAEEYMTDGNDELKDYKVFNFNGVPRLIEVDYNRFKGHLRNLYSTEWEKIDATIKYPSEPGRSFDRPAALGEMLHLAKDLSIGIPHVRTDFYIVDGKVLFGELTFFHGSGMEPISPASFNETMGQWLKLPDNGLGGGNLST